MRILFIGGGTWGTAALKSAAENGYDITVVDSQGVNGTNISRVYCSLKKNLHKSSIAKNIYTVFRKDNIFYRTIWKHQLPVILSDSINARPFLTKIKSLKVDLILVASCSEILCKELIKIPPLGCINLHPSLLPKYRGPNPFFWVLQNKEKETGITFHYINEKIDDGDIILQKKIPIFPEDDEKSLVSKSASLGALMILEVLELLREKKVNSYRQNKKNATYYSEPTATLSDNFTVEEIVEGGEAIWEACIKKSPQYNIFSSFSWLQTISKATGGEFKVIIVYQNKQPLCGCAAFVKPSLEGSLFTGSPLSQYSSILLFPQINQTEIANKPRTQLNTLNAILFLSEYLKSRFDWIVFYLHPKFENNLILNREGWIIEPRYTYYIDTRDEEKFYSRFKSSLKRQIKKGQRGKFTIKRELDRFDAFYKLWEATMRNQNQVPPFTRKEFDYIYKQMNSKGFLKTFCAYDENGVLAAVVIFLIDNKIAFYWVSTLNNEYRNSGVNQYLLWEGLKIISKEGVEKLDFVGADVPSIARYKKGFGGGLILHHRISFVSSIRARAVRKTKEIYKSFS